MELALCLRGNYEKSVLLSGYQGVIDEQNKIFRTPGHPGTFRHSRLSFLMGAF